MNRGGAVIKVLTTQRGVTTRRPRYVRLDTWGPWKTALTSRRGSASIFSLRLARVLRNDYEERGHHPVLVYLSDEKPWGKT